MKLKIIFLTLLNIIIFQIVSGQASGVKDYNRYVNLFTGSSNSRWQMFPGPAMPFGMVKLSPDNQGNVYNGGYEYTVSSISGFSHLHSMGISGLSLMPVTGNFNDGIDMYKGFAGPAEGPYKNMWTSGYRSRIDKKTETARPGYYSVELLDYNIQVELTATIRCGMLKFTYPKSNASHIIIDYGFKCEEKNTILDACFKKESPTRFVGYTKISNQWIDSLVVYFVIELNKAIESADAWTTLPYTGKEDMFGTDFRKKRPVQTNITEFRGKGECGVILNFSTRQKEVVLVQTAISFVSIEQAEMNLDSELMPFNGNFEKVVGNASQTWDSLLSRIEVFTDNDTDKGKFYTSLYRTYSGKSIVSDVNGKYTDGCGKIQILQPPANAVFSADGFWGGQWNLSPLWSVTAPEYMNSYINSLLELQRVGGWIPEAPVALKYAPIMGAQHHNSLIISAFQKGINRFDAEKAYAAIKHDYTTQGIVHPCGGFAGNRQLDSYEKYGYVPEESGPMSNTLEYAYDDWCLGQFALSLGKKSDFNYFNNRSENYKNAFDTTTRFIRRRHADGTWVTPFDPYKFGTEGGGWNGPGYMEADAFIYSFFVPHDLPGMIHLMGLDLFNNRLEEGLDKEMFDLSNQPSLEIPFLFNYSGKPWLTQKYSRFYASHIIDLSPYNGWFGEEDEGQLSAMFVLTSIGLFETDGGCSVKPRWEIASPIFEKVVIHLDPAFYKGKEFIIETHNNSSENIYIQSAILNGKPLNHPWLYHSDIANGGKLILEMGPMPNKDWGSKPEDSPADTRFYK